MYIDRAKLENFEKKFAEENDTLPDECCKAAEETVEKFLGYCPELREYTASVKSLGSEMLDLPAWISSVESVDGESMNFEFVKNHLFMPGRAEKWRKGQVYTVVFKGGYEEVPLKIVTVALKLAALYWESAGGNIAVSSTSYADSGTRVFNNFSEDRILKDIEAWRIYR